MIILMVFSWKLPREKILLIKSLKSLKDTCERIHFSNVTGFWPAILIRMECFTYILKDCA